MLAGLSPKAEARNSVSPATQQNKTSLLSDRITEGDAVGATARRIGNAPQSLTARIRVKPDPNPFGFNPTDGGDFDLSKTAQTLTLVTGGIEPRTIIIQMSQNTAHEPEDRPDVIASVAQGAAAFEARVDGSLIDGEVPTGDRNTTESLKAMEGDKGPAAFSMACPVPHAVSDRRPIMLCHGTSTETVGDDVLTEYEAKGGTVTIPADGGTTAPEMQTAQVTVAEPEEKLPIRFHLERQSSPNPKLMTVNTFAPDVAAKTLAMKTVVNDTPQPSQHLANLNGAVSVGATGRIRAGLAEGSGSGATVIPLGDTPTSSVAIPPELSGVLVVEATSSDGHFPTTVTIGNGQESGSTPPHITNDTPDERCREPRSIEIDNAARSWPQWETTGDHSHFDVVMPANDKVPANLPSLSSAALTVPADARAATCQFQPSRRSKAVSAGTTPFAGASADEGGAGAIG